MEPREFKDDVFSPTAHDVEEVFLGDSFNVCVKGVGITNCTGFVCSLVNVANGDGGSEFFCREVMLSDKLPVDARDVGTGIYQCRGVNDFEGVRGSDQLYRDLHKFVRSGYKYRGACY